jgi:hypothetical protein
VRSRQHGVSNTWWDEPVPANHPEEYYSKFNWILEHFQAVDFEERSVRQQLAKMRRAIEFMDATRLRPSKAWVRLFGHYPERGPRGMDHTAVWRDEDRFYVVTTEPYLGASTAREIEAWCQQHDWRFAIAENGRGIWYPCKSSCPPACRAHTRMLVMAPPKNGGDPVSIVARLGARPV